MAANVAEMYVEGWNFQEILISRNTIDAEKIKFLLILNLGDPLSKPAMPND